MASRSVKNMPVFIKHPIPTFITVLFTILCTASIFEFVLADYAFDKGLNVAHNDHIAQDSCAPVTMETTKSSELLSRSKRAVQCPSGWTVYGNNCYFATKAPNDQPTAEVGCRDSKGHLASIASAEDNSLVNALATYVGAQSVWLGLRFEDKTRWKWLNQLNSSYANWNNGQPDNPAVQRCIILNTRSNGRWETRQCFPDTADGYVCITPVTIVADPCQSSPCENSGYCRADGTGGSGYSCVCRSGFSGPTCSQITSACSANPCLNGGTCVEIDYGGTLYQCNCATGFIGTRCEQTAPVTIQSGTAVSCSVGTCANGGTCAITASTARGFQCTCPPGFAGVRCEIDINECTSSPCQNGATCMDGINQFACRCTDGWSGTTCSQQISTCIPNPCQHNGQCYALSVTDHICKCADGYIGTQCENDVNECDYGICARGATCLNTPGSFQCICPSGSVGATCSSSAATSATNPNACAISPCRNGGTCYQSGNTFSCSCLTGYSGPTCQTVSITYQGSCSPNPCLNNGICSVSSTSYICTCLSGYSGQNCQYGSSSNSLASTACSPNPCQNGGNCTSGQNGGFTCWCSRGYTGRTCAVPCPVGWSWSNSACYFPEDVSSNYEQAIAVCPRQQPGSYLLTVESQTEFDNAAILMNQLQSDIWMGLKYNVSRAQFVWITGQALGANDFTAWGPQQPNNPQTKNCARITASAGFVWIMEDCNRSLKLVCKYTGY